jgi:AcrR family transcriptional regulator
MSADTRGHVLEVALALFRKLGFDKTTMRTIAEQAGLSLGAAYYYFPSKEAIVLAYYEAQQERHARLAGPAMGAAEDLRARLGAVFHTKLDVLARDRKILGALFRSVGDPSDSTSLFGPATRSIRIDSVRLFDAALAPESFDDPTRHLLGQALWLMHLGIILFFVHDTSPKQEQTRRLVDGTLDLVAQLPRIGPILPPLALRISTLLREAGLPDAHPTRSP